MFLSINQHDNRPLYLQIIIQIKEQVGNGTLKPGDELPSVREVADSLGINLHTVRSAYLKLRDRALSICIWGAEPGLPSVCRKNISTWRPISKNVCKS